MTPERKLAKFCANAGVPYSLGEHLLPLVRQALKARGRVRKGLVEVIERHLGGLASELTARKQQAAQTERQTLNAVASMLHDWDPDSFFRRGS